MNKKLLLAAGFAKAKPAAFPATCKAGIEALQKSRICSTEASRSALASPWRIEGCPTSEYDGWLVATDSRRAALLDCGDDMAGVKPAVDKDGEPLAHPNILQVIPDDSRLAGVTVPVLSTLSELALAATMTTGREDGAAVSVYDTDAGIKFSAPLYVPRGEYMDTDTVGARLLFACNPHYLSDALVLATRCGISELTLTYGGGINPFSLSAPKFVYVQMPILVQTH